MAASQSQIKFRSISLPSRLHPINSTEFESKLQKINSCSSENAPITSETIRSGLLGLAELYNSIDRLAQHNKDPKSIDDLLDSSVHLLDSCNTIRELVQMIRESVRALQSALRRKGLACPAMQDDVSSYFCSRKKMNKCIDKGLKALKSLENKNGSKVVSTSDWATINVFKSTLVFLSMPVGKSCGWNLISRLMITKSVDRDQLGVISEVGLVDTVLCGLRNGDSKAIDVKMVQKSLQNLDDCIEGIEAALQRLFRQLLQNRVTLLNIVTNH
ncbi:Arabidopsis protein of unknown function (DUF241 [Striga hermonthica]|uniref:Uncharacterized protein n=1 Tax=Striga hermonthica TaxID=68872 RepID=A0A9N7RHK5_STRHE|nr:Arabidopsis protein of unknown function (DUF241 [Striga hermonthica]